MTTSEQDEIVRAFFEEDSRRYIQDRYPEHIRTCSQFSYLARKIHVFRMLSRVPKGGGRLLDIGCGPGVYTRDLLDLGWSLVDVDLSAGMVAKARTIAGDAASNGKAGFAVSHAGRLPFDASTFDCVLCIGVVSYIEDLGQALAEIARILKPSGSAIFQISNKGSLFELGALARRTVFAPREPDRPNKLESQIRFRPYWPREFREACRAASLQAYEDRYFDFSVPIISGRLPAPSLWVARRLEKLGSTQALAWLGASYLVAVRRANSGA